MQCLHELHTTIYLYLHVLPSPFLQPSALSSAQQRESKQLENGVDRSRRWRHQV